MAATSKRGGTDRLMVLVLLPASFSFLAATFEGVLKIRLAADLRGLPIVAGVAGVDGTGRFR